jgi:hypothetical protein
MMDELPAHTNEAREKRAKDELNIEQNTLLRSAWDKATYQVTKTTDTHVKTDDGETHLYTGLKRSLEADQLEIIGTRATN